MADDDEEEFNQEMDDVDENLVMDNEDEAFMNFNPSENNTKLF